MKNLNIKPNTKEEYDFMIKFAENEIKELEDFIIRCKKELLELKKK